MTPLESPHRELSYGNIYTEIRQVVREILSFQHEVFGFMEGGVSAFFYSTPHM